MKKASIILAGVGVVLFVGLFFCGVDVLDEQAFRWRLEYWTFAGSFACFAAAMILCAIRTRKLAVRIVWAVLSLLPLYVVVDTVRCWPRLVYSDSHYQMWANRGSDREYWKLYYGMGLVMTDAGGTPQPWWGKLDSSRVVLYDSLGAIWVETWSSHQGKPFEHEGCLVPIDSRFSKGNYELHSAKLDSLLAVLINDSVAPGTWDKTRTVLPKEE